MFSRSGRTRVSFTYADLSAWAKGLYRIRVPEPQLRGAIFSIEQLELHAKNLASTHRISPHPDNDRLIRNLAESERVIARCHGLMTKTHSAGRRLSPAAEWLLDNNYLIEEHIYLARKHLPRGYSRQLPKLAGSKSAGTSRIYDLISEFISHVDGRVDEEALSRYTAAYQSVTHLTLGELWAVAIMLRLALIENLRRVAVNISWQRAHRDSALAWAERIEATSDQHESALLVIAEMIRENPPLSTAFVTQFTQSLQGRGATTTYVLAWLEQRLGDRGQTIEEIIRAESQKQAADQASMANTISSLRLVNAIEWYKFVESHSSTEKIMRNESSKVYPRMDFSTRDEYRHAVESLARRFHVSEEEVARTAVRMADDHFAAQHECASGHVGYVLIDDGRNDLRRVLRGKKPALQFSRPWMRRLQLLAYLLPVSLLSALGVGWLVFQSHSAPYIPWLIMVVCSILVASQCALAVVNWFASIFFRPRALPRMDFEHGIPDEFRTMVVVPTLLSGNQRITMSIEGLERRYLANRDSNLWFGLLTDFNDAAEEHVEGDEILLEQAVAGIEELNEKYGNAAHGRFFLFHRPRLFNPQEGCWMGS